MISEKEKANITSRFLKIKMDEYEQLQHEIAQLRDEVNSKHTKPLTKKIHE